VVSFSTTSTRMALWTRTRRDTCLSSWWLD
jgi:hypothetical protein